MPETHLPELLLALHTFLWAIRHAHFLLDACNAYLQGFAACVLILLNLLLQLLHPVPQLLHPDFPLDGGLLESCQLFYLLFQPLLGLLSFSDVPDNTRCVPLASYLHSRYRKFYREFISIFPESRQLNSFPNNWSRPSILERLESLLMPFNEPFGHY